MPNNTDLAQQMAAFAFNSTVNEIVKEIDLKELGDAFKDVPPLKVNVNPPGIFDVMLRKTTSTENPARNEVVNALAIMTNIDTAILGQWADPLLYAVFFKAHNLYWDYWGETRKNSKPPAMLTSTP